MFRQLHTRAIPSTTTAASVAARPKYHLPSYNLISTCGPSTRPLQLINNLQLRGNIGINANAITNKQLHTTAAMASATGFYDFKPLDKRGQEVPLADYKGKVVLVVNTASKCGFTPQYAGLEKLYKDIKEKHGDDFVVLGFPCNQFGGQEPGSDDDIQNFCQVNYGVSFPIMQKTDVNGDNANPLFQWLKEEKPGIMGLKRIKWNFEKFLIGRDGQVKGRWASTTKPESLEKPILEELAKK
ncbi:Glutathione peroxidase [Colletotrichum higginsianum IMI 349063]|uniref:Glutathione peroxidase n=1 Tax=Colletotrichum higginsianum (strain IMI 349063) TaxID=759273 RepID=A0A1B7YIX6_COLHI|nr:Glutathione peroxidase [Colletotrichum higginsianum IMI 349063]OBR11996.1 Glutathione peroxidase [Colletotrichum higginsianum IMI 349063]